MTPPTDTLYKFLAISGLIITLTFTTYCINEVNKLSLDAINISTDSKILEADSTYLSQQIKQAEQNLKSQNINLLAEKSLQAEKQSIMIEGKKELMKEKLSQLRGIVSQGFIFSILGVIMSAFGFRKWYYMEKYKK